MFERSAQDLNTAVFRDFAQSYQEYIRVTYLNLGLSHIYWSIVSQLPYCGAYTNKLPTGWFYMYMYVCVCVCVYIYIYIMYIKCEKSDTSNNIYIDKLLTGSFIYIYIYIYTHTYIHTYIHTHIYRVIKNTLCT